jgi:cytochrome c oxidase subunit IV
MTDATAEGHGASTASPDETQHHPLKVYFVVWAWLFILSACSYFVDYVGFQGYLRWTLILIFMMLKAGLIVAVFMHFKWERLTLIYAVLLPTAAMRTGAARAPAQRAIAAAGRRSRGSRARSPTRRP